MHETNLLENIFQYLEREEKLSSKIIKKIYISLSEFAGIDEEYFRECYKRQSAGTRWESMEIEIKKNIFGPELEITKLEFK